MVLYFKLKMRRALRADLHVQADDDDDDGGMPFLGATDTLVSLFSIAPGNMTRQMRYRITSLRIMMGRLPDARWNTSLI